MQSPLCFVTRPTKNSKRFVINFAIPKRLQNLKEKKPVTSFGGLIIPSSLIE